MTVRGVATWCVVILGFLGGVFVIVFAAAMPLWWSFTRISLIYGVPLITLSLLPIRSPSLAWKCDLIVSALLLLISFGFPPSTRVIPLALAAAVLVSLLAPGLFWLVTTRKHWPSPLQLKPMFLGRVPVLLAMLCAFCFFGFAFPILLSLSMPWWPLVGDCGPQPLLDDSGRPRASDFTARLLFVPRPPLTIPFYGHSLWAIARVEQRFSAARTAVPGLIILRGIFAGGQHSETYFVEGSRSPNSFIGLLPVVEALWCGHTKPLSAAQAEVRILREGLPKRGARIIGTVYASLANSRSTLPGVTVMVEGPDGNMSVRTDAYGVFEVSDLPPGDYQVQLASENASTERLYNLKKGQIAELHLYLQSSLLPQ